MKPLEKGAGKMFKKPRCDGVEKGFSDCVWGIVVTHLSLSLWGFSQWVDDGGFRFGANWVSDGGFRFGTNGVSPMVGSDVVPMGFLLVGSDLVTNNGVSNVCSDLVLVMEFLMVGSDLVPMGFLMWVQIWC
jgi:hypothetical protein